MAITFPREMLRHDRFLSGSFDISRGTVVNRSYGGGRGVMELADPVWAASYRISVRSYAERAAWHAWIDTLQAGARLFYGYHPMRQYPIAYGAGVLSLTRVGGGAFDGTATLADVTNGHVVSLSDLPANYRVSVGDMIGIPMTVGFPSVHRVVEAGEANSLGAVTVQVEPFVRAGWSGAAHGVNLIRAACAMVIKQESVSAPDDDLSPVAFEAESVLA